MQPYVVYGVANFFSVELSLEADLWDEVSFGGGTNAAARGSEDVRRRAGERSSFVGGA
jgi:hypothetical protein